MPNIIEIAFRCSPVIVRTRARKFDETVPGLKSDATDSLAGVAQMAQKVVKAVGK